MPPRALKVSFATDAQSRERFAREVEILRRCDSPYVLKVYDHNLEWKEHVSGVPALAYYVCEKCDGSLEQRRGALGDCRRRLALFRQACAAVTHLHTMADPVIHRDLKPANFLVARELQNLVMGDLGIARPLAGSALTEVFEVVGTQYYRAPEVLHGDPGTIQSDVYSLGRLLEWLLTGDVSKDMATRPVPRGGDLHDEACDVLDRIITKATQVAATNRFASAKALADQVPDLWLAVRPRPTATPAGDMDAGEVFHAGLELARKSDQLGWRQLQSQVRRELAPGLVKWRADNEGVSRHDGDKAIAFEVTDRLLNVARSRIVLALAGVYSGNGALADQRRVVDDFVGISGWNRSGTTALVEGPRAMIFLLHYLHGALCLINGLPELALQFAEERTAEERVATPLWLQRDLTGWPKLIGGKCIWAWEYLRGLREREPLLQELFALPKDYEVGIAAYSMLLSMLEFAKDAASASPTDLSQPANVNLDVPPLFTGMDAEVMASAARRTCGDRAVVELVAQRAGAKPATMRQRWPSWKKVQLSYLRELSERSWGYPEGLPLGDLA